MVNNVAKIKNLFTKPKTGSMYLIKLIKESFFINLSKTISRPDCWKEEREFTPVTPFLELYASSCLIKMSPNNHVLYGIHTNKKYQSKIGLLEPFFKTLLSLFFSIFFFSQKRGGGRRKKKCLCENQLHFLSPINPRE